MFLYPAVQEKITKIQMKIRKDIAVTQIVILLQMILLNPEIILQGIEEKTVIQKDTTPDTDHQNITLPKERSTRKIEVEVNLLPVISIKNHISTNLIISAYSIEV